MNMNGTAVTITHPRRNGLETFNRTYFYDESKHHLVLILSSDDNSYEFVLNNIMTEDDARVIISRFELFNVHMNQMIKYIRSFSGSEIYAF